MTCSLSGNSDARVPLREWIESETEKRNSARQTTAFDETRDKKEWILRKTTVAFGITELLIHSREHSFTEPPSKLCSINNFSVRICDETAAAAVQFSQPAWKGIKGVDMISPQLSSNIVEPSFLCSSFFDDSDGVDQEADEMNDLRNQNIRSVELTRSPPRGRYLEVEFPTLLDVDGPPSIDSQIEEYARCHLLGVLLHELFSTSPLGEVKLSNRKDRFESESKTNEDTSHEPVLNNTRLLDPTLITTQLSNSRQQQHQQQQQQRRQQQRQQQQQRRRQRSHLRLALVPSSSNPNTFRDVPSIYLSFSIYLHRFPSVCPRIFSCSSCVVRTSSSSSSSSLLNLLDEGDYMYSTMEAMEGVLPVSELFYRSIPATAKSTMGEDDDDDDDDDDDGLVRKEEESFTVLLLLLLLW